MSLTKSLSLQQMDHLYHVLTEEYGITLLQQIKIAGSRLAETANNFLKNQLTNKTIIVLAGVGKNGAVGLAAANALHQQGATIRLVLTRPPAALHDMAAHQYQALQQLGITAWGLSLSEEEMQNLEPISWSAADLIIDALLGPGIKEDPRGDTADLIRIVNTTRCPILSFDVPSGLSSDQGLIYSPCIQANATMTMAYPKRVQAEGWPVVRDLWVADMDVPRALYSRLGLQIVDVFNGEQVACLGRARKLK